MGLCASKLTKDEEGDKHDAGDKGEVKSNFTFGYDADFSQYYKLGKELGRGQYGITYRCTSKTTGKEFAAKRILKKNLTTKVAIEDVEKEVKILRVLKGKPNIVEVHGVYESSKDVTLVLELCTGGELFQSLLDKGKYSEYDASVVMQQILTVVADCHLNGVIHRDLKPENFLYASTEPGAKLKLTDFGLSDFFSVGEDKYFTDVAGSAYYVAPEVLRRKYGPSADLWSCGVIMYILLTGEVPFWAPTEAGIFKQVLKGRIDFSTAAWQGVSRDAKQLLLQLLDRDPERRTSASSALVHPWIDKAGVASDKPLDIKIVSNMRKFVDMNRAKRTLLLEVAKTFKEDDIAHLRAQFSLMDKDNSGTITVQEMIEGLSALKTGADGRNVYDVDEIVAAVKGMDVDQDGEIDYMEFVAACMGTHQMCNGPCKSNNKAWLDRVRLVFNKIDDDGNGYITPDELKSALGDGEDVQDLLKKADKNGDGKIDFEEFHAVLREDMRVAKKA